MKARAGTPGTTGTHTGTGAAGGHIHQLINLAAALTTAATNAAAANTAAGSPAAASSTAASASGGSGAGSSGAGADPVVPAPLGVNLDSLGDAEVIEWARTVEHLSRYIQA
ncbi:hypothetical protein CVV68_11350, partial [Arthrobacter livingstonensis]